MTDRPRQLRVLPTEQERAMIEAGPSHEQGPSKEGQGPVEQYAALANLLAEHPEYPELADKLIEHGEWLVKLRRIECTGELKYNLQTGRLKGGPVVRTK